MTVTVKDGYTHMARTRRLVRSAPAQRADPHRYPVTGDVKSYLVRDAPRPILDRALKRAHSEGTSLRVVLIDYLKAYSNGAG